MGHQIEQTIQQPVRAAPQECFELLHDQNHGVASPGVELNPLGEPLQPLAVVVGGRLLVLTQLVNDGLEQLLVVEPVLGPQSARKVHGLQDAALAAGAGVVHLGHTDTSVVERRRRRVWVDAAPGRGARRARVVGVVRTPQRR